MKLKFLIGTLCLGLMVLVSCNKDDDGPSEPAFIGTLKGKLTDLTALGAVSDYTATSITATHDTTAFLSEPAVKIEVTNSAGVKIVIHLADTAARPQPYYFRTSSVNKSTVTLGANNGPYTTQTDDIPYTDNGVIVITDNGMDDGILRGNIMSLSWYKVVANDTDSLRAILTEGEFEVPLTRTGFTSGGGSDDATLTATIDGVAFNSTFVFASGLTLTATNASLQSFTLGLPDDATLGEHQLNAQSDYSIMYSSSGTYYVANGTINISALDVTGGTATGTFQFTGTPASGTGPTVAVTNGAFSF